MPIIIEGLPGEEEDGIISDDGLHDVDHDYSSIADSSDESVGDTVSSQQEIDDDRAESIVDEDTSLGSGYTNQGRRFSRRLAAAKRNADEQASTLGLAIGDNGRRYSRRLARRQPKNE